MPVDDIIAALFAPGGALYERNQAVRPMMERHGLRFCYWVYEAPEGTSPFSWGSQTSSTKRQIADLGGPFQLLRTAIQPLREIYQGTFDRATVTVGYFVAGPPEIRTRSTQREHMVAVVAIPGADLGSFCTEARGLFAGKPVLPATVADLLAREPGWKLEGKHDRLVIRGVDSPPDRMLTVAEMTQFVDGVFRIAPLFGARMAR